jgi:hypothetical protein
MDKTWSRVFIPDLYHQLTAPVVPLVVQPLRRSSQAEYLPVSQLYRYLKFNYD